MSSLKRARRGFTLIELLLVIGIIAILASIVIVAINPTRQLAQARDTQRRSDVNTLINAIYQYSIDEDTLPACIQDAAIDVPLNICSSGCVGYDPAANLAGNGGVASCDLTAALEGDYLVGIPVDARAAATYPGYSGYQVVRDAASRLTVTATETEIEDPAISVQR